MKRREPGATRSNEGANPAVLAGGSPGRAARRGWHPPAAPFARRVCPSSLRVPPRLAASGGFFPSFPTTTIPAS